MSVWWDRKIPAGETYSDFIAEQLKLADVVVVIWSRDSIRSQWVQAEADRGKRRDVLIPVLLDDVADELPLGFALLQAVDFRAWNNRSDAPEVTELLAAVKAKKKERDKAEQGEEEKDDEEKEETPPPRRRLLSRLSRRRILIAGGVAVVALLSTAAAIFALADGSSPPTETRSSPPIEDGTTTTALPFEDDFSSQEQGWRDVTDEQNGGSYAPGAYLIHAKKIDPKESNQVGVIVSPTNAPTAENVRIDVEAVVIDGTAVTNGEGYAYGIVCRATEDFDDLYRFTYWPKEPGAHIQKRLDGKWYPLTKNDDLPDVGEDPELQAQCVTTPEGTVHLEFAVNGERTTWTDKEPLGAGAFGLNALLGPATALEATLEVQFDNFAASLPVGRR